MPIRRKPIRIDCWRFPGLPCAPPAWLAGKLTPIRSKVDVEKTPPVVTNLRDRAALPDGVVVIAGEIVVFDGIRFDAMSKADFDLLHEIVPAGEVA